jgi:hypothetical protein
MLAGVAASQYAGSKTCQPCHPNQFANHAPTGHAHALSSKEKHKLASLFPSKTGEWAFGAGTQAITFVGQVDEEHYLEHGLSWYAATKSLELTPGHRAPSGERYRTFDPSAAILRCFQCHSTGPLRLDEKFRIEPFEPGVQCETCHGPGSEHAASLKPIRNPKRMSAAELNDLCGGCHRMPAATGSNTDWTNPWNTRHQPLYLAQSACYVKSNSALSCSTCHTAHMPLNRNARDYDRACSECHAKPRHRTPVSGRACVACHMPAVEPQPNLRFANHWIGIYAAGKPLRPIAQP